MSSRRTRRLLLVGLLFAGLLCLAVFLGVFRPTSVAPDLARPLTADEQHELRPRGRELAMAADCFGCHSRPEGPTAAGGVAIGTPFGTLHSTNITPDPTYGIGQYTRADFHRALRDGVAPGGRNLYPAMPYVFTHRTTPEDVDALYAYLMSIPPIAVPNVPNTGVYMLPVRGAMNFWNLLNFPREAGTDGLPVDGGLRPRADGPSAEQAALWTRGAYLVEGLGHCAACHTPMNFMMGTDFSRHFQGAVIEGLQAPDIRAETLGGQGYTVDSLSQFLRTGISRQGTSFGGMFTVTHASTSHMAADDVEAMAVYLLTGRDGAVVSPATPAPPAEQAPSSPELAAGRLHYVSACAGCHGMVGEGIPHVAPAMQGNATLINAEARNFIKVVLDGIETQAFAGNERMYAMPGFADRFSDEEIAQLTNWARTQWGGQTADVSVEQVGRLRKE